MLLVQPTQYARWFTQVGKYRARPLGDFAATPIPLPRTGLSGCFRCIVDAATTCGSTRGPVAYSRPPHRPYSAMPTAAGNFSGPYSSRTRRGIC